VRIDRGSSESSPTSICKPLCSMRADFFTVDKFSVDKNFLHAAFPLVFHSTFSADNNRGLFFCFPNALGRTRPLVKLSRQAHALFRQSRFGYPGYNGLRGRPPCKKFIQSVTDSLKTIFGATQIIYKDVSNEKKRSKNST